MDSVSEMLIERSPFTDRSAREGDIVLSDDDPVEGDRIISDPSQPAAEATRRVLRPEFVPHNSKDSTAQIKVTLMHQRRGQRQATNHDAWEDADHFDLRHLNAGQHVKLALSCGETKSMRQ